MGGIGIIKKSKAFLLLWDPSYDERMRSIFELAAFLKSRPLDEAMSSITIKPIFLGPCALPIFAWCFFFTGCTVPLQFLQYESRMQNLGISVAAFVSLMYPAALVLRRHCHAMASFQKRLKSFQFAATKCFCCSTLPNGHFCDRQVLLHCIRLWFGLVARRNSMRCADLLESVTFRLIFPFQLYVVACPVVLLDLALYHQLYEGGEYASYAIHSLGSWVLAQFL